MQQTIMFNVALDLQLRLTKLHLFELSGLLDVQACRGRFTN